MFLVWNLHHFLWCIFFFTWLQQTFFKISLFYYAQLLKKCIFAPTKTNKL